jgi:DNA polymerase/3'-5' exonuclease PolX
MADFKGRLIEALDVLRRRELSDKAFFKAKAYAKVIDELRISAKPIEKIEDIDGMPGVGEKIRKKVEELLATGHIAAADRAKEEHQLNAVDVLSGVYGIGVVKAKELIARGIKTIAALRAAVAEDPKLLNDKQKIGLRYYEDILERIPRAEMKAHEKILLKNLTGEMKGTVVGSYRRGAADSGDIDVLLTMPHGFDAAAFDGYVDRLVKAGYMTEILSKGDQKCLSVVQLKGKNRRLDLLVVPIEEFPCALLYFTGSGDFNVAFRKHALSLGYTLNEHEMKLTGKVADAKPVPPMKYEAEIFAFLGLKYKEPHQRIGAASVVELSENTKTKVAAVRRTYKKKKNGAA